MNNLIHIDDALLTKYLTSETDTAETAAVEAWTNHSAENKRYLEELAAVWEQSLLLAAGDEADEDAAWQRFKDRTEQQPARAALIKPLPRMSWLRIAALFILVAGLGLLSYKIFQSSGAVQQVSFTTGNEVKEDTLSDGSIITLNKASSISYPVHFNGATRPVTLKGEAFFKVAPDKQKPFLIHVNDVTIRVVGTSFNVRSYKGATEVVVETGIVQVMRGNRITALHRGEKINISTIDSLLIKKPVDNHLYNYYRSKEFVCEGTRLAQLVQVLNEAYDAHIVIGRSELNNLPLTATFHNESLDNILTIISATFDIKVLKQENRIILQ